MKTLTKLRKNIESTPKKLIKFSKKKLMIGFSIAAVVATSLGVGLHFALKTTELLPQKAIVSSAKNAREQINKIKSDSARNAGVFFYDKSSEESLFSLYDKSNKTKDGPKLGMFSLHVDSTSSRNTDWYFVEGSVSTNISDFFNQDSYKDGEVVEVGQIWTFKKLRKYDNIKNDISVSNNKKNLKFSIKKKNVSFTDGDYSPSSDVTWMWFKGGRNYEGLKSLRGIGSGIDYKDGEKDKKKANPPLPDDWVKIEKRIGVRD